MFDFDVCNVVIDNGFEICKVGFEGDDILKIIIFFILGCFKF